MQKFVPQFQICLWCLSDTDFVLDKSKTLKNVFVGGLRYAGIRTDPELPYPKSAGRVASSNQQSYVAAISSRRQAAAG